MKTMSMTQAHNALVARIEVLEKRLAVQDFDMVALQKENKRLRAIVRLIVDRAYIKRVDRTHIKDALFELLTPEVAAVLGEEK